METMHLLRDDMRGRGVRMLVGAAAIAAAVVGVFDWDPLLTAAGALASTAALGAWQFHREVRTRLPSGPLPPAPAQAAWHPRARLIGELVNVALLGAGLGALVWLLGDEESALIGSFVIGRFAGSGVAALIGARQVRRWERRHSLRVAFAGEDDDERRFAVHPLALISRP